MHGRPVSSLAKISGVDRGPDDIAGAALVRTATRRAGARTSRVGVIAKTRERAAIVEAGAARETGVVRKRSGCEKTLTKMRRGASGLRSNFDQSIDIQVLTATSQAY